MKYIPIKIIHYTELRRGDLVSYYLPNVTDEKKDWDMIVRCCSKSAVLKFLELSDGAISYDVVYSGDYSLGKTFATTFDKDRHELILMSLDGTGTGQPQAVDQPDSVEGVIKFNQPNK